MAERTRVTSLMTPKHNAAAERQQCGSQRRPWSIKDGNALWHGYSGGCGDAGRVARSGGIARCTQAEVRSARRTDTPLPLALVDVTAADWRICGACGGVADRSAKTCGGSFASCAASPY